MKQNIYDDKKFYKKCKKKKEKNFLWRIIE